MTLLITGVSHTKAVYIGTFNDETAVNVLTDDLKELLTDLNAK